MTTMSSPAEKPWKRPFGKSERNSPDVQQAGSVDRDHQASPVKDTLPEGRKPMEEIRFLQKGAYILSQESAKQSDPPTKTSWTIMLYIAADGLLANFAVESLKQLSRSASTAPGKDDQASVVVAAQFSHRCKSRRTEHKTICPTLQ